MVATLTKEEAKELIHEFSSGAIINFPRRFSILDEENVYFKLTKAYNQAVRKIRKDKLNKASEKVLIKAFDNFAEQFSRIAPIIVKSVEKWEEKKYKELQAKKEKLKIQVSDIDTLLNVGNFAILKKDVEAPKVSDYNSEEDPLVKKTKVILASKMIQLKRLLKKHPFVAKYIHNQLDALNKFVEQGNYKQGIVFVNELIARVERAIADEEGKVAMLEISKTEDEAKMRTLELMDKLSERLGLDDTQLLGKEYFSEEEARKKEREKKRIVEGKYIKKPKPGKASKPPKQKVIGISKPLTEDRNLSLNYQVPEPEVVEEIEDKVQTLEESFRDLTEKQRQELLGRLLKRKLKKMKEVE